MLWAISRVAAPDFAEKREKGMQPHVAEAQAFVDGDPFTKAGMFTSVTITRMNKGQFNPAAAEGA
jgi:hypothetical protein